MRQYTLKKRSLLHEEVEFVCLVQKLGEKNLENDLFYF